MWILITCGWPLPANPFGRRNNWTMSPKTAPPGQPLTAQPPPTSRLPNGTGPKWRKTQSFGGTQETRMESVDYHYWSKKDPLVGDMADEMAGGSGLSTNSLVLLRLWSTQTCGYRCRRRSRRSCSPTPSQQGSKRMNNRSIGFFT